MSEQDDETQAVDAFVTAVNRATRTLEQLDQAWQALPEEVKQQLRPPLDMRQKHERDDRQQQPK